MALFDRLKAGLAKTAKQIRERFSEVDEPEPSSAPASSGGFGSTGKHLGEVAALIVQSPGYATGVTQTIAQTLPDAVLGVALLG